MNSAVGTKLVMTAERKSKPKAERLISKIGANVAVVSAEDEIPVKRNQRHTYVLYLEGNEKIATVKHSLERVAKSDKDIVFLYVNTKPNPRHVFELGALCQQFFQTNRGILFSYKELAKVLEQDTPVPPGQHETSADEITIEDLRKRLGLTQGQLSKIAEVTTRTIQNWERERKAIQVSRSLSDLAELQRILSHHIANDDIPDWLNSPNEKLEGTKPIELLEHGHTRDLLWQLRSVAAGEPA